MLSWKYFTVVKKCFNTFKNVAKRVCRQSRSACVTRKAPCRPFKKKKKKRRNGIRGLVIVFLFPWHIASRKRRKRLRKLRGLKRISRRVIIFERHRHSKVQFSRILPYPYGFTHDAFTPVYNAFPGRGCLYITSFKMHTVWCVIHPPHRFPDARSLVTIIYCNRRTNAF